MTALDEILSYLEGPLGLSPAQAAGVAGNLQTESGFSPTAYNAKEGAIGLAQWEGGRRTNLQTYAAQHHTSETDLTTQLGFLGAELSGPEIGAYSALSQTTTPEQAAAVFDQQFERSSGSSRATRIANAKAIAAGHPTSTGPAGDGSGGSGASSSSGSGGGLVGSVVSALYPLLLKVAGVTAAAGLVIVGAVHTVSDK